MLLIIYCSVTSTTNGCLRSEECSTESTQLAAAAGMRHRYYIAVTEPTVVNSMWLLAVCPVCHVHIFYRFFIARLHIKRWNVTEKGFPLSEVDVLTESVCLFVDLVPSVLWCCWLGVRKGIQPVKIWLMRRWRGYLLERSANSLHMVQLMPLPPHHACFS